MENYETESNLIANCENCRAYQQAQCEGQEISVIKYDGQVSKIYGLKPDTKLHAEYSDQYQYTCQKTGMTKVHKTEEMKRFIIDEEIADLV